MGCAVGAGAAGVRLRRDRHDELRRGIQPRHAYVSIDIEDGYAEALIEPQLPAADAYPEMQERLVRFANQKFSG
jgi:hypothetical protein